MFTTCLAYGPVFLALLCASVEYAIAQHRMNKENWWRPIVCTAIIVLIPAVIVVASVFAIGLWRIF